MYATKSIGYATDLMLASFDGEISRGNGYIAVRTPSCPLLWWGNFVLFADAPKASQVESWEATYDDEVGRGPEIKHRNLAWDATDDEQGAATTFVSRGYALARNVFLMTDETIPSKHHRDDTEVRPIQSDDEWLRALKIEQESLDPERVPRKFRALQTQQMRRNQRLTRNGFGNWFGAFIDGEMVATMGLFVKKGLARCQGVATARAHRRKGYCSTLVHEVCSYGFTRMGTQQVVVMTEPDTPAERIYESVGFTVGERVSSLSTTSGEELS